MVVFAQLRALAEFRERHLPFLETVEDQDIVREIGHHQALGAPLTLKQLVLSGLGSVATIQRRLTRLKELGVVHESKSPIDRRAVELTLSPATMKAFGRYGMLLTGFQASSTARRVLERQPRHMCGLCDGLSGCYEMAVGFLREGLRQGQTCVVVGGQDACDAAVAGLERAAGHALGKELIVSTGRPTAEGMLEFFRGAYARARAEGKSVRAVGDMKWTRGYNLSFEEVVDFERRLDVLHRRFRGHVLCQYDAREFSSEELLRAMKCHPDSARYPVMLG